MYNPLVIFALFPTFVSRCDLLSLFGTLSHGCKCFGCSLASPEAVLGFFGSCQSNLLEYSIYSMLFVSLAKLTFRQESGTLTASSMHL